MPPEKEQLPEQAKLQATYPVPAKESLAGWITIGGAWILTISQLQGQWNLNPQYTYGWLTLPLAIFLLWRESEQDPEPVGNVQGKGLFGLVCIPCILAYLPLWMIQGANPEWRMLNWLMFLPAAILTATWFYSTGGTQSLGRVAFPLFFISTSIPWLLAWDLQLATYLQGKVSYFVRETLLLAGRSADIEGNLIRLSNCTVGVDEACSGIRGLQSSVVVSLFLGQFLRLKIPIRLLLVFASIIFAFGLNLIRASFLAHLSASKGTDMASKWHDPIGIAESLGTLLLLCLLIFLLIRVAKITYTFHIDDSKFGSLNFLRRACPKGVGIFAIFWFPACVLASVAWYHYNENHIPDSPRVKVDFHTHTRQYENQRISDAIRSQLNYTEALSTNWISDNGQKYIGFFCRWEQGSGSPLALAVHTPEVCLQLRGFRLIGKHDEVLIQFPFHDAPIPFEAYTFNYNAETIHIYRCYWPEKLMDGKFPGFPKQGYSSAGRIKATLKGFRNPGATMVAIGIFENELVSNFEIATESVRQELQHRILPLGSLGGGE